MRVHTIDVDGTKLKVFDSSDERKRVSDDIPFTHYCARRKDALMGTTVFKRVCQFIAANGGAESVLEMFVGSGWHAALIQQYVKPSIHMAFDISDDCVKTVKESLPGVDVYKDDAYRIPFKDGPMFSWIHLDFNTYTMMDYLRNKRVNALVDAAFEHAGRFVTVMDSAVFGNIRFPKNRNAYFKTMMMDPADWKDYYRTAQQVYQRKHDFTLDQIVVWSKQAAYLTFSRGRRQNECAPVVEYDDDSMIVRVLGTEVQP